MLAFKRGPVGLIAKAVLLAVAIAFMIGIVSETNIAKGYYSMQEEEDKVLVMFERGNIRRPYIIGSLWSGADQPPTSN